MENVGLQMSDLGGLLETSIQVLPHAVGETEAQRGGKGLGKGHTMR